MLRNYRFQLLTVSTLVSTLLLSSCQQDNITASEVPVSLTSDKVRYLAEHFDTIDSISQVDEMVTAFQALTPEEFNRFTDLRYAYLLAQGKDAKQLEVSRAYQQEVNKYAVVNFNKTVPNLTADEFSKALQQVGSQPSFATPLSGLSNHSRVDTQKSSCTSEWSCGGRTPIGSYSFGGNSISFSLLGERQAPTESGTSCAFIYASALYRAPSASYEPKIKYTSVAAWYTLLYGKTTPEFDDNLCSKRIRYTDGTEELQFAVRYNTLMYVYGFYGVLDEYYASLLFGSQVFVE
jgi:hypothetical protein